MPPPTYSNGHSRPWYDDFMWYWDFYFGDDDGDEEDVVVITPPTTTTPATPPERGGGAPRSPEPKPEPPKPVKMAVDLLTAYNKKDHHCDKYGIRNNLIIRRGQEFKITVTLDTAFNADNDKLEFQFSKGNKPQVSKRTRVNLTVHKDEDSAKKDKDQRIWYGYISSVKGDSNNADITAVIVPSPNALVGTYKLVTKVYDADPKRKTRRYVKKEEEEIYVLFNAWCKDDPVYLEDEDDREEYVLRESGRLWKSKKSTTGSPWNFGHFSNYCLRAAVYLLDNSYLASEQHGKVVDVCRALTAMANSSDPDNGVLTGNWSGDYDGGRKPWSWNGSEAILRQYMETKKPVKFGQCWVFSGLMTTLCRTLGIPTRSVTNFNSAHDNDGSCTIDKHFDTEGDPLKWMDDSVWNFHVWNEAWFKRADLPQGYDGWQAVDSTPQEQSGGMFRCGPAPVKAIKEGDLHLGYDTKFIFAEVNGERINWTVYRDGDMVPSKSKKSAVGYNVYTKAVGRNKIADVTKYYKYREGSSDEREAVEKAMRYSTRKKYLKNIWNELEEDVDFTSECDIQENGDVTVNFSAKNKSNKDRTIIYRLTAVATHYDDTVTKKVYELKDKTVLDPSQKTTKNMSLNAKDYLNDIGEEDKLRIDVWCSVRETDQIYETSTLVEIEKPDLDVKVSYSTPKVGQEIDVTITMTNPSEVELTECKLNIEGPGIIKDMEINLSETVAPKGKLTHKVTLTPKYEGTREIVVSFNSRQLVHITGYKEIKVHT